MQLVIKDKAKKDLFHALFQTIRSCSSVVCIVFKPDAMKIQGMDKSHVCLFEVTLLSDWFSSYEIRLGADEETMCFDTNIFHTIISTKNDGQSITIYSSDADYVNIDFVNLMDNNGGYNKRFKLPLVDYEYENMNVPLVEYDAEFTISSKKMCELVNQMAVFGEDLNIKCSEEKIDMITTGVTGEMLVTIPIDDLDEYSIIEGDVLDIKYNLVSINRMCLTNKLSPYIGISMSPGYPMRIKYDLGTCDLADESSIVFYIAPKIEDE